jgi:hypothetical protein
MTATAAVTTTSAVTVAPQFGVASSSFSRNQLVTDKVEYQVSVSLFNNIKDNILVDARVGIFSVYPDFRRTGWSRQTDTEWLKLIVPPGNSNYQFQSPLKFGTLLNCQIIWLTVIGWDNKVEFFMTDEKGEYYLRQLEICP